MRIPSFSQDRLLPAQTHRDQQITPFAIEISLFPFFPFDRLANFIPKLKNQSKLKPFIILVNIILFFFVQETDWIIYFFLFFSKPKAGEKPNIIKPKGLRSQG